MVRVKVVRRTLASTGVGVFDVKVDLYFRICCLLNLKLFLTSQRRVQLAVRQLGALCKENVLSMPLFELYMVCRDVCFGKRLTQMILLPLVLCTLAGCRIR